MNLKISGGVTAISLLAASHAANATPQNLVQNGNFSQSSYSNSNQFGSGSGSNGAGTVVNSGGQGVTDWQGGSAFQVLFVGAGAAATLSANTQYDSGYGKGSSDFWSSGYTSPPAIGAYSGGSGANFVALDGTSQAGVRGTISQSFTNLQLGDRYQVTFEWAGGQFQSHSGNTTDTIVVSLGGQTYDTPTISVLSESFSPWQQQTFYFIATNTAETLTFMNLGTPNGLPPVAALYGVSMYDVPEPGSLALLGGGLALVGFVRRRKTRK